MGLRLSWTRFALADLRQIRLQIARDSVPIAEAFVQRLFDSTARLSEFPFSGPVVPEFGEDEVREIIHGSYRLIYEVLEDRVRILTVRHGARLITPDDVRR